MLCSLAVARSNSEFKVSKYDVMVNWSSVVIGSRASSPVNDTRSAKMIWNNNFTTISIQKKKGVLAGQARAS